MQQALLSFAFLFLAPTFLATDIYRWDQVLTQNEPGMGVNNPPNYAGSPHPGGRYGAAAVQCGISEMCVFGGFSISYRGDLWVYDALSTAWTYELSDFAEQTQFDFPGKLAPTPFPGARVHHSFFQVGGSFTNLRLFGGKGYSVVPEVSKVNAFLGDVWDYDRGTGQWTFRSVAAGSEAWYDEDDEYTILPFYPSGRFHHQAWNIGDDLFVWGGRCDGMCSMDAASTWRFYDVNGTWERILPPSHPDALTLFPESGMVHWTDPTYPYGWLYHKVDQVTRKVFTVARLDTVAGKWVVGPTGIQHKREPGDDPITNPPVEMYGRAEMVPDGRAFLFTGNVDFEYYPDVLSDTEWEDLWFIDLGFEERLEGRRYENPSQIRYFKPTLYFSLLGGTFPRYYAQSARLNDSLVLYGGFRASESLHEYYHDLYVMELPWDCVVCAPFLCADGFYNTDLSPMHCNARGTCDQPDGGCVCNEGYTGAECEIHLCRDAFVTQDYTLGFCGGHGTCDEPWNPCECQNGYDHNINGSCLVYECADGKLTNETDVCNGLASCDEVFGECLCPEHSRGVGCEDLQCVGGKWNFDEDEPSCGSRGACLLPGGPCVCDPGSRPSKDTHCRSNAAVAAEIVVPILLVGIAIGVAVGVGLVLFVYFRHKRQQALAEGVLKDDIDKVLLSEVEDVDIAEFNIRKELYHIDFDSLKPKRTIGKGGSNAVVMECDWNGVAVAFKIFQIHDFLGSKKFDEFQKEVEILASVSHPNILSLFLPSSFADSSGFYGACLRIPRVGIVMEMCQRGDLKSFLEDSGNAKDTPLSDRLRLLSEIAIGMAYLHDLKIIHRDLKPENVLLDDHLHAKIMDFGLSRVFENSKTEKTFAVGTSSYMAPEMVQGVEYDGKVDVFAFGIIMFSLLVWTHRPYGKETTFRIEYRVANDENYRPEWPKTEPQIDERWTKLAVLCWSAEQTERPSFAEYVDFLSRLTRTDIHRICQILKG